MPANRNALIRYKTIDNCLRNRRRKWILEDLVDKVSEALYEYEGIDKGISRRTIQGDIQVMRSDKLGYNAPIIITEKKYYTYSEPDYSITNLPLTVTDLERMAEAVEVLKQFRGFAHFSQLGDIVQKLEGHVYASSNQQRVIVHFEKNEQLKGLEHLSFIYDAIVGERVLQITYQSFKARNPGVLTFHPWWLKEFKNRWFLVGVKDNQRGLIMTLALDRMIDIQPDNKMSYYGSEAGLTPDDYYSHVIGVTVSPTSRPVKAQLLVTHRHAPYLITKPLHHSQRIIETNSKGVVIEICVQHNFELEKEILGFGDGLEVLKPEKLRNAIRRSMNNAMIKYDQASQKERHRSARD